MSGRRRINVAAVLGGFLQCLQANDRIKSKVILMLH